MDKIPRDIIYFVPQYFEIGDGVLLLLLNGEKKICPMSIRSFTKKLYSIFAIDPLTIKKLIQKR